MCKTWGFQTNINENKLCNIAAMVHTGPFPRSGSSWYYGDIYFRTVLKKKKKQRLNLLSNHIISHKYYMLQTKLYLDLKFSSMLDIYLRHCFKIVFEIFHVMGRWPLFSNKLLILILILILIQLTCRTCYNTGLDKQIFSA